jgi:hypothetical protein
LGGRKILGGDLDAIDINKGLYKKDGEGKKGFFEIRKEIKKKLIPVDSITNIESMTVISDNLQSFLKEKVKACSLVRAHASARPTFARISPRPTSLNALLRSPRDCSRFSQSYSESTRIYAVRFLLSCRLFYL